MGLKLEKASKDLLGSATKVVITKNSTLIVTDGSNSADVEKRVSQIRKLVEVHLASLALTKICHLKFITSHKYFHTWPVQGFRKTMMIISMHWDHQQNYFIFYRTLRKISKRRY